MDYLTEIELEQIVDEVFWEEERQTAELRLSPGDAEKLTRIYGAECMPMNDSTHTDGKRWYRVWMPI